MNHPFDPVFDSQSKVLILGTFPSVLSRSTGFYYGHPQNRFWKVMSVLCNTTLPTGKEDKIRLLQDHHLALWDVLSSCEITGSQDASIKDPIPQDLSELLHQSSIRVIAFNGKKAAALFRQVDGDFSKVTLMTLPSTSAANAAMSLDELVRLWNDALRTWIE